MAKKENNDKKPMLSDILAKTFELYLENENRPIDTLLDFEQIKEVLPVPEINGVDNIERHLTEANKEEIEKIVNEVYINKNYGKLMEFLSFAYPISYSNKGQTITDMYNVLREELNKKPTYELTYEDLRKVFETEKPLEKFFYDSSTLSNQFKKKGKLVISKQDKIKFLIQGYKVAKFFENHQDEMEHFRKMQEFFYGGIPSNKANSKIREDLLKELDEKGYDIMTFRRTFYNNASTDPVNNRLMTSDIYHPSSALDSIEMKNVVEADKVLRSVFIGKYVEDYINSKGNHIGFDDLSKEDKALYPNFFRLNGEQDRELLYQVKEYAGFINKLVNKIFSNDEAVVKFKPFASVDEDGNPVFEEYSKLERAEHKNTVRKAIIDSAIRCGAFASEDMEEFKNRLAYACTGEIVTKHFNRASLSGVQVDDNNEPIDFVSDFPDSKNDPFASQNRKCAVATIYYEGRMYFVKNIPATVVGDSTDILDDNWKVSITEQELNALIVNLTDKYGVSFCNLNPNDIKIGKNPAALSAVRLGNEKGKKKVSIETAFDVMKKLGTQNKVANPFIHQEDQVADFTTYNNEPYREAMENKEQQNYSTAHTLSEILALFLQNAPALTGSFNAYADRTNVLETVRQNDEEKRNNVLNAQAEEERERYVRSGESVPSTAIPSKILVKQQPQELNKVVVGEVIEPQVILPGETQKTSTVEETKTVKRVTLEQLMQKAMVEENQSAPKAKRPAKPVVKNEEQVVPPFSVSRLNVVEYKGRTYFNRNGVYVDAKTNKEGSIKKQIEIRKAIAEHNKKNGIEEDYVEIVYDGNRYTVKDGEIVKSTGGHVKQSDQVEMWKNISKPMDEANYETPKKSEKIVIEDSQPEGEKIVSSIYEKTQSIKKETVSTKPKYEYVKVEQSNGYDGKDCGEVSFEDIE